MCQPEQQFHLPLPKRVNVTGMQYGFNYEKAYYIWLSNSQQRLNQQFYVLKLNFEIQQVAYF